MFIKYESHRNMQLFVSIIEVEITESLLAAVRKSTISKSQWAIKVFKDWLIDWKIWLIDTPTVLNYCLKYFYCDVRKENGER